MKLPFHSIVQSCSCPLPSSAYMNSEQKVVFDAIDAVPQWRAAHLLLATPQPGAPLRVPAVVLMVLMADPVDDLTDEQMATVYNLLGDMLPRLRNNIAEQLEDAIIHLVAARRRERSNGRS